MPKASPLDRPALELACREVVRSTLWQVPNPQNIDDIIDADQIEALAAAYVEEAQVYVGYVTEMGRDPNLVTRAVQYLAAVHAIPPMKDDVRWFRNMLHTLVELACPNVILGHAFSPFFDDIRDGLDRAEELD